MELKAPRTLNAPTGCRLSGLIHSGRSGSAQPAGSRGVRTMYGRISSAAARMSSIVTSCTGQVWPKRAPRSNSRHQCLAQLGDLAGDVVVNRQVDNHPVDAGIEGSGPDLIG